MDAEKDFIDLNVPGLMQRYSNPSNSWNAVVRSFATTQLHVFRKFCLIKETASALSVVVDQAVVRFSDYTPLGQAFVKSGAVDKWLASCDRKQTLAAYQDSAPLERRISKFIEA